MFKEYYTSTASCNVGVQHTRYAEDSAGCLCAVRTIFFPSLAVPKEYEILCSAAVVQDTEEFGDGPVMLQTCQTGTFIDVALSDNLSPENANCIKFILHEFSEVFSDKSRVAKVEPHKIILTARKPVKVQSHGSRA